MLYISSLYMILIGLKSCSISGYKILDQLSGPQAALLSLWTLASIVILVLVSRVDEKNIDAAFIGRIQLALAGMGLLLYLCHMVFCN